MNKIATVLTGLAAVGGIVYGVNQSSTLDDIKREKVALASEVNQLDRTVKVETAKTEQAKKTVIKKASGFDPDLIAVDQEKAVSYFEPAFSWSSGKAYDSARAMYDKQLGKGNSFTKTYLANNTKIDTDGGKLSYIDFKGLSSRFDDLYIVPTSGKGDTVRYVGFVRYIMKAKDASKIENKNLLKASEAILEFTVSGKPEKRVIRDVVAKPGYASLTDGTPQ